MRAAQQRGMDPAIALKVAKSEGLGVGPAGQSNFRKNGIREPSYGPFQLLVGGPGTGFPAGMGNDFMSQTGLDPRKSENWQAGVDFALDRAKSGGWGPWYGAKKVGVNKWDGINGAIDIHDTEHDISPSPGPSPSFSPAGIPRYVAEYATQEEKPNMLQRLGAAIGATEGTPGHIGGPGGGAGPGNQLLNYLNSPTMADILRSKRVA